MFTTINTSARGRQLRLVLLLLIPVLAILGVIYLTLFRSEMTVLARDIRPEEAAAIVAQLKKQDVPYQLSQQGSTILVPSAQADELRLELVAGEIAPAGSVGFELFNQSDMGLTDFDQKVKYQRALQGELTRTIMTMEGIASARVHLSVPERSLFRANRSEPRAAVTIIPKPDVTLDPARIAGIQRLVAATIPDLEPKHVTVLNQRGELVSQDAPREFDPASMINATALERAYAGRIAAAIRETDPELEFDLRLTTNPRISDPAATIPETPEARDYAVRAAIFTRQALSPERQGQLASAIASAIGVRIAAGDEVRFSLIPQENPPLADETVRTSTGAASIRPPTFQFDDRLIWVAVLAAMLAFAGFFLFDARRRRRLRHERLVVGLKEQLRLEQVGG